MHTERNIIYVLLGSIVFTSERATACHAVGCKNCSKKIRFVRCSDRAAKFSFSQNFVTIFTSSKSYLFSSQPIDKILSKLKLIPLILILKKKE